MRFENEISLKQFNTFGVASTASNYVRAESIEDIRDALTLAKSNKLRTVVLGGGSNILFAENVDALVLHIANKGKTVREMGGGKILVDVAAGESWPELVCWAVCSGYGGIENLAMIPGTAGAAPVQNIGAYGIEFRNVCHSVTALNRHSGVIRRFSSQECNFGYRDSVFKQTGEWIITSLSLILDRNATLSTEYGALKEELQGITNPGFADVKKAIISIRSKKLPAVEELGSAGSFFKNPVVPEAFYLELHKSNPELPGFNQHDGTVRIPAAWLLDSAGWKGKREGDVGCYHLQPLIIVNYGAATGAEILQFSKTIQRDIVERFGVHLEREVVLCP